MINKLNKKNLQSKTIIVSGATGFVGRNIVYELIEKGYCVISLVRSLEKAKKIPQLEKSILQICDINKNTLDLNIPKNSTLIHCAWQDVRDTQNIKHIEIHFMNNYNFLKKIIDQGVEKIIVTGTCYEYGISYGPVSTLMVTNPNTPYGLAKDTLHKALIHLQATYNFKLLWLRLFYVYGEGQDENSLIPVFDKALDNNEIEFKMTNGEQLIDYLPIEDAAKKIIKILSKEEGVFNICSGNPISLRRFLECRMIEKNKLIKLNLGFFEQRQHETLAMWGEN
jgi:nucleoside-diphosphate-sugar epimerase